MKAASTRTGFYLESVLIPGKNIFRQQRGASKSGLSLDLK